MDASHPQLRTAQILVAALLAGVATFAAVVGAVVQSRVGLPPNRDLALPLGLALGAMLVAGAAGAVWFTRFVVRANRQGWANHPDPEPELMLIPFVNLTIVRAMLLEGPALFGVVGLLMTGEWMMLGGTAIGAAGLLVIFPTRDRFDAFVRAVSQAGTI